MVDNKGLEMNNEDIFKEAGINKEVKFIERILATVIDQIVSLSAALVLLIVFDFILKILGLYIAERQPMFLIVYIIVNIIYAPICESTKLKKTIGRKIVLK